VYVNKDNKDGNGGDGNGNSDGGSNDFTAAANGDDALGAIMWEEIT
jgi:hypothetical protein